jgi:hypothetical protein
MFLPDTNLRMRYSEDLETRNSSNSGSLGVSCHTVWIGDSHKRGRGEGLILRSLSSKISSLVVGDPVLSGEE